MAQPWRCSLPHSRKNPLPKPDEVPDPSVKTFADVGSEVRSIRCLLRKFGARCFVVRSHGREARGAICWRFDRQ